MALPNYQRTGLDRIDNIEQYAASTTDIGSYLPLAGGTVTSKIYNGGRIVSSTPDQTSFNEGSITTAFNGDYSNTFDLVSHQITGASTLTQPSSGYVYVPQAYPHYTYLYNSSGWNDSTSDNTGRTGAVAYRAKVYQTGQGDAVAFNASGFVNSTRSGSTSFLANPAVCLFNGDITGGIAGCFLNPGEFALDDGGFDVAGVGWVVNMTRTVSTGAKGAFWAGFLAQSKGAASIDAFFAANGPANAGLDLTAATLGNSAAVTLKTGQRIYLNATNSGTFPNGISVGTTWIDYDTGSTAIRLVANNTATLQITNGQVSVTQKLVLADVDMQVGTSTGTKVGTATSQKLAFHNSTPVIQRVGAAQAAVATTAATNTTPYGFTTAAQADAIVTLVNELRAALVEKGLIKGAA